MFHLQKCFIYLQKHLLYLQVWSISRNVNALPNSSTSTLSSFPECSIPSPEGPHCFQNTPASSSNTPHPETLQLISRQDPFSETLRLAILGMQKKPHLKQNKTKKSISRRILISLSNVPLFHLQKLPSPEMLSMLSLETSWLWKHSSSCLETRRQSLSPWLTC